MSDFEEAWTQHTQGSIQEKHKCCKEEREHNLATLSVYCLHFDQWLSMNYCGICRFFVARSVQAQKKLDRELKV